MPTVTVTNISSSILYCRTAKEDYTLLPGVETPIDTAAFATWCRKNSAFIALLSWPGKVVLDQPPFA